MCFDRRITVKNNFRLHGGLEPLVDLIKDSEGICWGELLHAPAYEGGEFESLFWVREAQCTYGELNQEQLSKLGSRGKAARAIAPFLRKEFHI